MDDKTNVVFARKTDKIAGESFKKRSVCVDDRSQTTRTTDIHADGSWSLSDKDVVVYGCESFLDFKRVDETFLSFLEHLHRNVATLKSLCDEAVACDSVVSLSAIMTSSSEEEEEEESTETTKGERSDERIERLYERLSTFLLSSGDDDDMSRLIGLMNEVKTTVDRFHSFYETGLSLGAFEDDGYADTIGYIIVDEASLSKDEEEEEESSVDLNGDFPYEECVSSVCSIMLKLQDTLRRMREMHDALNVREEEDDDDDDDVMEEEELSFYAEISRLFARGHLSRSDILKTSNLLYRLMACLCNLSNVVVKRYPKHWRRLRRALNKHGLSNANDVALVCVLRNNYETIMKRSKDVMIMTNALV